MSEETRHILLDILQILVPAILITGGGAVAYWKYRQDMRRVSVIDEEEKEKRLGEFQLEAEKAAWDRVRHTIEMQAQQIQDQEARIQALEERVDVWRQKFEDAIHCIEELEGKFGECERVRELIEQKNHSLVEENKKLKEKLDDAT